MQEEEPGTLWPPVQGEQLSVAPVLKVLAGQSVVSTRNSLTMTIRFPAPTVLQKAVP